MDCQPDPDGDCGAMRDSRIDPQPGDVFRKWNQTFTVDEVNQGIVSLMYANGLHWHQGTLGFRQWAKDAEVIHVA